MVRRAQRAQARVGQHLGQRAPVAAQHQRLEIGAVREQHARGDVGGRLERHARLALAPAREAPLAGAARAVAAVHEPRADLRVHQPRAREHAGGVAAQAHEQHADHAVAPHVLEQRLDVQAVVDAGGRQRRERRVGVERRAVGGLERHPLGARSACAATPPCCSAQRASQRSRRSGGIS